MCVFFQEVMIISRKNSRVHAREGGRCICETIVKGQRVKSHRWKCTIMRSLFVRMLLSAAFCVAVIQIESIHTVDAVCTVLVFWKQFCAGVFTL